MTAQLDLYNPPGRGPARARRTDPDSSHSAADWLERSGKAAAQSLAVLRAIRRHQGRSTKELALLEGMERHIPGRRTSELERRGYIRRDDSRRGDLRWWLAPKGLSALRKIDG